MVTALAGTAMAGACPVPVVFWHWVQAQMKEKSGGAPISNRMPPHMQRPVSLSIVFSAHPGGCRGSAGGVGFYFYFWVMTTLERLEFNQQVQLHRSE